MSDEFDEQVRVFSTAVSKFSESFGVANCRNLSVAANDLLLIVEDLRVTKLTGSADSLLDGVQAAIVEAAGCVSLGLSRPALFSLRAQIDMFFSWLYFKDHPIEWNFVEETGNGFKLKSDVIKYLKDYVPKFSERFAILQQAKTRIEDDPYRLLSAHVHSQSSSVIPVVGSLNLLVSDQNLCNDCISIQREVTEFLSDHYIAIFGAEWTSIPDTILQQARKRLTPAQQNIVFS